MNERRKNRLVGVIGLAALVGVVAAAYYISHEPFDPSSGARRRTHLLSQGGYFFRQEREFYPGQQDVDEWLGRYSGSQILAAHLFGYGDDYSDIKMDFPDAKSLYAKYERGMLDTVDGRTNVLLDDYEGSKAICYYVIEDPDNPDFDRLFEQNAVHTQGTPDDLRRLMEGLNMPIPQTDSQRPYRSFLLLSPGRDRTYFTSDDVENW